MSAERAAEAGVEIARRSFPWSRPEWCVIAVSVVAWAVMLVHGLAHWGHAHHHRMTPAEDLLHWTLMIAAMMLPLILDPVRIVAFRSFSSRRHRSVAFFLAGYLGPWLALGVPVVWLRAQPWTHTHAAAAAAFAVAALWIPVPVRRRALVGCHQTIPLAPWGRRADIDCLRYGTLIGGRCVTSCWALMVACTLTGHDLPAVLGGALIGVVERRTFRPSWRLALAGTVGLCGVYFVR